MHTTVFWSYSLPQSSPQPLLHPHPTPPKCVTFFFFLLNNSLGPICADHIHWNVANLPKATSAKKTYSFPQQPTTVKRSLVIMEFISPFLLYAGMLTGLIRFRQGQTVDVCSWGQRSCHAQKLLFLISLPHLWLLRSLHLLCLYFPGDLGWGGIT